MTKAPDLFPPEQPALPVGIEWEYHTLRGEILSRIQQRQQILSITLTIAGIFMGVGLGTPSIALVYPPLAMFLAYAWAQNDFRVREIAEYIRNNIEGTVPGLKWERSVQKFRAAQGGNWWRFSVFVFANGGVFLWTQVMAIGIGISRMIDAFEDDSLPDTMAAIDVVLIIVGVLSFVVTWILIHKTDDSNENNHTEAHPS